MRFLIGYTSYNKIRKLYNLRLKTYLRGIVSVIGGIPTIKQVSWSESRVAEAINGKRLALVLREDATWALRANDANIIKQWGLE